MPIDKHDRAVYLAQINVAKAVRKAGQDVGLDRGTMCRYAEDVGASLGAIVEACADEARKTAFCLSTDATGV